MWNIESVFPDSLGSVPQKGSLIQMGQSAESLFECDRPDLELLKNVDDNLRISGSCA